VKEARERGSRPAGIGRLHVEVVRGGAPAACEIGPDDETLSIGRSRDQNRLVIDDKSVSRRHAVIECKESGWRIRDLESLNGVRLRGRTVPKEGATLSDGDEIQLGVAVLRVRIGGIERDSATIIEVPPAARGADAPRREREAPRPAREATPRAETPRETPRVEAPRVEAPRAPAVRGRRAPIEQFDRFEVRRRVMADESRRLDLALDTASGREVLLLRMAAGAGGLFGFGKRKKVRRAYEQAQRLAHENVLPPTGSGEAGGEQFFVYPDFDGLTVSAVLGHHKRDVPVELGAYVGRELCRALAYLASALGSNARPTFGDGDVLIGRDGRVVLLVGTEVPVDEHYRSPEEDAGEKGGVTSAVFSAGILLYELLARERIDTSRKLTLPSIDTVRLQVTSALAEATMRAIEVRPQDRIATPGELERELDEALRALGAFGAADVGRWITERLPE
jgi:hypothetical protein